MKALGLMFLAIAVSARNLDERITGGNEAEPNSHPYQVGLIVTLENDQQIFCGGSLISTEFVLTAANCVNNGRNPGKSFDVILGAHSWNGDGTTVTSTEAIVHPEWNHLTMHNDIALIKLPSPVTLNDKIGVVEMPPRATIDMTFVGYLATATGWGKTSDAAEDLSSVLHEVTSEVITNTVCNGRYLGTIQPSQICASGSNGRSSCIGDAGGPLTAQYNGRKIQIGVISYGVPSGCEVGWPPVNTRLSRYLDWISDNAGITIN